MKLREWGAQAGIWWRHQMHPGTCRQCGRILRDDNEDGFCSDECSIDWTIDTDF